jgi:hypothetical protein
MGFPTGIGSLLIIGGQTKLKKIGDFESAPESPQINLREYIMTGA